MIKINKYSIFLFILFYLAPFVDALSGYLVLSGKIPEGGAGSPSQLLRFILIPIMILILLKKKKYLVIPLVFAVYIFLLEGFFSTFHHSIYGYIIGIVYGFKFIYLLLIFLSLSYLYKINQLNFNKILFLVRNSILISSFLILVPFVLGIGFSTYDEGTFGTKGFFAAGNGLGIYMGIGLLISINYWKIHRDKISFISVLIILTSTVLIGSKTALVFSFLGIFSIFYFTKSHAIKYMFVFLLVLVFSFSIDKIVDTLQVIFDVVYFRYQHNPSFFGFIMSERDEYFLGAISNLDINDWYLMRLIFGFGAFISFREPGMEFNSIDILESDISDIFFMYGFVILFIYLVILISTIIKSFAKRAIFLGIILIMLTLHSLLAGHVVFNGMSGIMVPYLIFLIRVYKYKLNDEKGVSYEKNNIYTSI